MVGTLPLPSLGLPWFGRHRSAIKEARQALTSLDRTLSSAGEVGGITATSLEFELFGKPKPERRR